MLPRQCSQNIRGKILATADAIAHLTTDIYVKLHKIKVPHTISPQEFTDWVLNKLDRDFHDKIFFVDVRQQMKPKYNQLKKHFQAQLPQGSSS